MLIAAALRSRRRIRGPEAPPPPPALSAGSIAAEAGVEQVTISQVQAPSGGSGSYSTLLLRSTSPGTGSLSPIAENPVFPFVDPGRAAGVQLWYTLRVTDNIEQSSEDTGATATPLAAGGATAAYADGLEGYTAGAALPTSSNQGTGALASTFRWQDTNGAGARDARISTLRARSGTKSLEFVYDATKHETEQRFRFGQNLPEYGLRFYLWVPAGWQMPAGTSQHKFISSWGSNAYGTGGRFYWVITPVDGDGGALPAGEFSCRWEVYSNTGEGTNVSTFFNAGTTRMITAANGGRWNEVRVHAKQSSTPTATDGRLRCWFDGQLMVDRTALRMGSFRAGEYFNNAYLLGNSGTADIGKPYAQEYRWYIDGVDVFTTDPGW